MDHNEALQQMAAEGYLLNDLTPDAGEAFEEHLFDCPECALDLRAGVAFMELAKVQLPKLAQPAPKPLLVRIRSARAKCDGWLSWLRPSFAVPVFASMLALICYQNLCLLPGLCETASQPQLLAWAPLQGSTRGAPLAILADRKHGVALTVELPQQPIPGAYTSYSFSLIDPRGQTVWTGSEAASSEGVRESQRLSLAIPSAMLRNGSYTLTISGVSRSGEHTVIDQYAFSLSIN